MEGLEQGFQKKAYAADMAAVAILFLLITVVFADVWQGSSFFVRDLTRYYFPTKRILHDIVRSGEFPLWNRAYSAGQPAAANPEYEVFYPGQLPIFFRDFFFGFRLHILLHFYVAALAMYALMRSLSTGVAAAMLAAVAFVFGGPLLSLVNLLPTFFCISWMPLTFLYARRYLISRQAPELALSALFFGLQVLAFEPAVLLETALLIAAYALYRGRGVRGKLTSIGLAALVVAFGAAIGGAQLLPTLAFMRATPRAAGLTFDAVSFWSMPPLRLGELLQPRFFGRNPYLSDDYWGGAAYRQASTPYLQSLYLGYAVLVAIVTGIVRRDRRSVFAVAASVGIWVVSMGENTPLLRLAARAGLPIPLRFPERFAELAGIVLTVAAGMVVERVVSDREYRATAVRVAAVLAVAVTALALFTFTAAYSEAFAAVWRSAGSSLQPRWIALSRIDWLSTAARAVALCMILLLLRRTRPSVMAAALVLFTVCDLVPYAREIAPRQPRRFFAMPAAARTMRQPAADYRIFFEPEWSSGSTTRRYFANAAARYWIIRNGLFPRLPAAEGFQTVFERDIDLTNTRASNELTEAMWKVRRSGRSDWAEPFMAMSNVAYRAAYRPFPEETARHPEPKDVEPIVFVPVALTPRYYFADEIVNVATTDDFTRRMIAERHSPRAAYVLLAPFSPAAGAVTRVRETSHGAVLEVTAPGRAFLVASVTAHGNWRATIDGLPAIIHATNVAFQGLDVPAGRHTVVFRYRDPMITAGVATTLLSLIVAAAMLLYRRSRSSVSGA